MHAINWMIQKAEVQTLEDGTVTYFFKGNLPGRMVREIQTYAKSQNASSRGSNEESILNWDTTLHGFAFITGARKSTQNRVRFSMTDYTVPAAAAGDSEAAWLEFMAS